MLTRLSFEKVFGLVACYSRNGSENVRAMSSGSFHAVSMVDSSVAGLFVQVKLFKSQIMILNEAGKFRRVAHFVQVVIKVALSGAQISTE